MTKCLLETVYRLCIVSGTTLPVNPLAEQLVPPRIVTEGLLEAIFQMLGVESPVACLAPSFGLPSLASFLLFLLFPSLPPKLPPLLPVLVVISGGVCVTSVSVTFIPASFALIAMRDVIVVVIVVAVIARAGAYVSG